MDKRVTAGNDDVVHSSDVNAQGGIQPLTGSRKVYAMGLLTTILAVNFLDRNVINILAEPIKHDLNLADWQLGLMTGTAFAVFYTVMGLPVARMADKYSRPLIITVCAALWSVFTVSCYAVQNFAQLLLARMGVGIGEAGCIPASHSLITDYVRRDQRGTALALYGIGMPVGGFLGLALGGLVAQSHGWRAAFLVAGIPGALLAVVAILTLREPRKHLPPGQVSTVRPTVAETARVLAGKRSYVYLLCAMVLYCITAYGAGNFQASFYLRNFSDEVLHAADLLSANLGITIKPLGFLGLTFGIIGGIGGAAGMWSMGWLTDRLAKNRPQIYMEAPAIAATLAALSLAGGVLVPSLGLSMLLWGAFSFLGSSVYGPVYATVMSVAPPNMRATASAANQLCNNLIGLGLGPVAVGLISDVLRAQSGNSGTGLRWAILMVGIFYVAAAVMFWASSRRLVGDLWREPAQE